MNDISKNLSFKLNKVNVYFEFIKSLLIGLLFPIAISFGLVFTSNLYVSDLINVFGILMAPLIFFIIVYKIKRFKNVIIAIEKQNSTVQITYFHYFLKRELVINESNIKFKIRKDRYTISLYLVLELIIIGKTQLTQFEDGFWNKDAFIEMYSVFENIVEVERNKQLNEIFLYKII
jgi:hypothetical protein